MTGDITQVPPANAALAQLRGNAAAGQVMTLFNAAASILGDGETAEAQVISLKQVAPNFQMLLRLNLANGTQTSVAVNSNVPLTPGTLFQVIQASPGQLLMSLQQVSAALNNVTTELDPRQAPPGTLLQGKVMTSQALGQALDDIGRAGTSSPGGHAGTASGAPTAYRSLVLLLNSPLAGTTISVQSAQALTIGSLLSARVQDNQSLSFVPLPGRLDQLAVAQQLGVQQSRQGSLDTLLTALQNLPANSTSSTPALQASIQQLLADLPDFQQLGTARGLAQAFNASGLFMEARLLAGQNLQQTPDLKASLMRLIAQILPGLPANTSYGAIAASNTLARVMPSAIRNALGTLGMVAARSVPDSFPLPSRQVATGEKDDLEMLLKLAAAAVSRLQSHQLGALEHTRQLPDGTQVTSWQLEVPARNAHDIVPLQVKVQREDSPPDEGQGGQKNEDKEVQREQLWRIDLAFDLEPLGPLQVHARLVRGTLSSQLWAEREASAGVIERELGHLRERLVACGLSVGELACSHGSAPQGARTSLEQRWIDENA
ncbi:flagellar hook-length control protein FliK [Pseudomonas syringae]|nr:flagellar hook-length control protein FliK [Pseudomonas syringae]MBD8577808.1 flagellar hook-length control protein FliK [Pseudomonas syringae]MBD8788907.1 flagellar hook-length control protein FliK [Pseudomonas syringae]MBD8804029.1 flagellar hook-length control protein FliK [Pseudomonas syringae]MBD8812567.1 flagellar hook-length control protein FliK [Pseudomonas syringae]